MKTNIEMFQSVTYIYSLATVDGSRAVRAAAGDGRGRLPELRMGLITQGLALNYTSQHVYVTTDGTLDHINPRGRLSEPRELPMRLCNHSLGSVGFQFVKV
jgi:hypothetical protein